MAANIKGPRTSVWHTVQHPPTIGQCDTWLEAEDFAYPDGGKRRRCRAKNAETGKLQIVRCGIPDTAFSIPCRGGGYVTSDNGVFVFHPPRPKEPEKCPSCAGTGKMDYVKADVDNGTLRFGWLCGACGYFSGKP